MVVINLENNLKNLKFYNHIRGGASGPISFLHLLHHPKISELPPSRVTLQEVLRKWPILDPSWRNRRLHEPVSCRSGVFTLSAPHPVLLLDFALQVLGFRATHAPQPSRHLGSSSLGESLGFRATPTCELSMLSCSPSVQAFQASELSSLGESSSLWTFLSTL